MSADTPGNSFLCPNGSVFNQEVFVCDWWNNVNCGVADKFYGLNNEIEAPTAENMMDKVTAMLGFNYVDNISTGGSILTSQLDAKKEEKGYKYPKPDSEFAGAEIDQTSQYLTPEKDKGYKYPKPVNSFDGGVKGITNLLSSVSQIQPLKQESLVAQFNQQQNIPDSSQQFIASYNIPTGTQISQQQETNGNVFSTQQFFSTSTIENEADTIASKFSSDNNQAPITKIPILSTVAPSSLPNIEYQTSQPFVSTHVHHEKMYATPGPIAQFTFSPSPQVSVTSDVPNKSFVHSVSEQTISPIANIHKIPAGFTLPPKLPSKVQLPFTSNIRVSTPKPINIAPNVVSTTAFNQIDEQKLNTNEISTGSNNFDTGKTITTITSSNRRPSTSNIDNSVPVTKPVTTSRSDIIDVRFMSNKNADRNVQVTSTNQVKSSFIQENRFSTNNFDSSVKTNENMQISMGKLPSSTISSRQQEQIISNINTPQLDLTTPASHSGSKDRTSSNLIQYNIKTTSEPPKITVNPLAIQTVSTQPQGDLGSSINAGQLGLQNAQVASITSGQLNQASLVPQINSGQIGLTNTDIGSITSEQLSRFGFNNAPITANQLPIRTEVTHSQGNSGFNINSGQVQTDVIHSQANLGSNINAGQSGFVNAAVSSTDQLSNSILNSNLGFNNAQNQLQSQDKITQPQGNFGEGIHSGQIGFTNPQISSVTSDQTLSRFAFNNAQITANQIPVQAEVTNSQGSLGFNTNSGQFGFTNAGISSTDQLSSSVLNSNVGFNNAHSQLQVQDKITQSQGSLAPGVNIGLTNTVPISVSKGQVSQFAQNIYTGNAESGFQQTFTQNVPGQNIGLVIPRYSNTNVNNVGQTLTQQKSEVSVNIVPALSYSFDANSEREAYVKDVISGAFDQPSVPAINSRAFYSSPQQHIQGGNFNGLGFFNNYFSGHSSYLAPQSSVGHLPQDTGPAPQSYGSIGAIEEGYSKVIPSPILQSG